jgi:hypothetical protein
MHARLKTSRAAGLALVPKAAGAGNSGLSRNTPPGGVLRAAQTASSHTPNKKPKSSHSANTARAVLLIATFHGTKLVHGRSWRVGEMTGARVLESDMVCCGDRGCGLGVGCKAHSTGGVAGVGV